MSLTVVGPNLGLLSKHETAWRLHWWTTAFHVGTRRRHFFVIQVIKCSKTSAQILHNIFSVLNA